MKPIALSFVSILALAAVSGCVPTTEFNGSAHFPGGAQACFSSCQTQNMEMSGFVMSGEFASSCVCRPRAAAAPAGAPAVGAISQGEQSAADVADVTALVGVVLRKRAQDEANAQQQRQHQQMMQKH